MSVTEECIINGIKASDKESVTISLERFVCMRSEIHRLIEENEEYKDSIEMLAHFLNTLKEKGVVIFSDDFKELPPFDSKSASVLINEASINSVKHDVNGTAIFIDK